MRSSRPMRALLSGAIAGALGTVAMDAFLFARYRAQGGDEQALTWEFGGSSTWDKVPVPAQVGRRLYEGFLERPLDERWARLTNNVMHWAYGIGWGGAFGIVGQSLSRRRIIYGPMFGATLWLSGYAILGMAGLYKPIWQYSPHELGPDLAAHLIYGTMTVTVVNASRGPVRRLGVAALRIAEGSGSTSRPAT